MNHPFVAALAALLLVTCAQSQVSPLGIQALGSILGFGRGSGGGFRSPFRSPVGPPPLPPGFGGPVAAGSFGVPMHSFGPQFSSGGFGSPFASSGPFGSPSFGPNPFSSGGYGSLVPSGSFSSPVFSGFNSDGFDTSEYAGPVGDYSALGSSSNPFVNEYVQSDEVPGMKRDDENEADEQ